MRINLDETSIRCWQGDGRGIVLSKKRHYPGAPDPITPASTRRLRGACTYVALAADDEEVQRVLPQVVLVSRSLCTVAAELRIRQLLPSNVYLLVLSSGWNNSKVMLRILRLVKDRLASCGIACSASSSWLPPEFI